MMRPDLDCSATAQQYRYANLLESSSLPSESVNCPEENDETADEANLDSPSGRPGSRDMANKRLFQPSFSPYQPPIGLPDGYSPPTPFPSWSEGCPSDSNFHKGGWLHPSYASGCSEGGYPSSLPSRFPSSEYPGYSGQNQSRSLPGQYSPSLVSLEQPYPLRSNSPAAGMPPYCLQPYPGAPRGLASCCQCPMKGFQMAPFPHHHPRPGYIVPYAPPGICGHHDCDSTHSGYPPTQPRQKLAPYTSPLSLEQRKVFVTYEADSDNHVNEIIKFVALLRHNGFDMHIDVFEQQFKSISKIDFMEKYISEKDYLIIIVISPKYYETVTGGYMSLENDERTLNTVYIHKQLQNEFIQNGSRNFRFIPILFPGAKQCHVPTWLQNTHVYGWPRDRDDILRRLMRVEKYNPPPIGVLPTIVSIPL